MNIILVLTLSILSIVQGDLLSFEQLPPKPSQNPFSCVKGSWIVKVPPEITDPIKYESEHFIYVSARQDLDFYNLSKVLEYDFNFYTQTMTFPEPNCQSEVKYKQVCWISDKFELSGGGTSISSIGGMFINPNAIVNLDRWGMGHELTHALQFTSGGLQGSIYTGWIWEDHANWHTHQLPEFHKTNAHCSGMLVAVPHIYLGSTRDRYCSWQFLEFLKDRYGFAVVANIWRLEPNISNAESATADPFTVLGNETNWSVSQLNDFFGIWAMANVNWDYENGDLYRRTYGDNNVRYLFNGVDYSLRVTTLEPINICNRTFRVPFSWAPQRWGYNLVKLIPENGATSVEINFQGVVQDEPYGTPNDWPKWDFEPNEIPQPNSDWRWGIVIIKNDGTTRSSYMMRGQKNQTSIHLGPDVKEVYLTVMATPKSIHKIQWDQGYYSIYRFPWNIRLTGAWPEGYHIGNNLSNCPSSSSFIFTPHTSICTSDQDCETVQGTLHPNGGGWKSLTAVVDPSVYLGRYVRVFGGKVLGNAWIADHAIVHSGEVSGKAIVGALSIIDKNLTVTEEATYMNILSAPWESSAVIKGNAQIYGDAEIRAGVTISRGVFYGFIDSSTSNEVGSIDRTNPVKELTAPC